MPRRLRLPVVVLIAVWASIAASFASFGALAQPTSDCVGCEDGGRPSNDDR